MKQGALRLKMQATSFFLKRGDCFAINSNAIHYAVACPSCELHTFVFNITLIIELMNRYLQKNTYYLLSHTQRITDIY